MFELIAFLAVAAFVAGGILLVGLVFKLLFKIVLLPFWLALGLIKLVGGLVVGIFVALLCLVLAPLAIVLVLFVGIPLLAIAALCGLGFSLVAA